METCLKCEKRPTCTKLCKWARKYVNQDVVPNPNMGILLLYDPILPHGDYHEDEKDIWGNEDD